MARPLVIYSNRSPQQTTAMLSFVLGSELSAMGQIILAEPFLSRALLLSEAESLSKAESSVALSSTNPNPTLIRLTLGGVQTALGKYPQAIQTYETLLQKLVSPVGTGLSTASSVSSATAFEKYVLDRNTVIVETLYRLGSLYDQTQDGDKAIHTLRHALSLEPDNPYVNYDLGVLYAKRQDFKNAALFSSVAVKADPQFAEALNNYGYALANLGQYQAALKAVENALSLKPESAAALDTKGFALLGLAKLEEARTLFEKALTLEPQNAEIQLHLAQVLEKLKKWPESIAAYQKYLDLLPPSLPSTQTEAATVKTTIQKLQKYL